MWLTEICLLQSKVGIEATSACVLEPKNLVFKDDLLYISTKTNIKVVNLTTNLIYDAVGNEATYIFQDNVSPFRTMLPNTYDFTVCPNGDAYVIAQAVVKKISNGNMTHFAATMNVDTVQVGDYMQFRIGSYTPKIECSPQGDIYILDQDYKASSIRLYLLKNNVITLIANNETLPLGVIGTSMASTSKIWMTSNALAVTSEAAYVVDTAGPLSGILRIDLETNFVSQFMGTSKDPLCKDGNPKPCIVGKTITQVVAYNEQIFFAFKRDIDDIPIFIVATTVNGIFTIVANYTDCEQFIIKDGQVQCSTNINIDTVALPKSYRGDVFFMSNDALISWKGDEYEAIGEMIAGPDGFNAMDIDIDNPYAMSLAPNGDLYFTDKDLISVFRMDSDKNVYLVAGMRFENKNYADLGDGADAVGYPMGYPTSVNVFKGGNMLIADDYTHVIYEVIDGKMYAAIGSHGLSAFADGVNNEARLKDPLSINPKTGKMVFFDTQNLKVRMITPFCADSNRTYDVDYNQCVKKCPSTHTIDHATDECVEKICFGIPALNSSVYSTHGSCQDEDKCLCDEGFSGVQCQVTEPLDVVIGISIKNIHVMEFHQKS